VTADQERRRFVAALELELRVVGRARTRILEEIRAHLDEAADDVDVLGRFGAPDVLARRFNDLHAIQSGRRALGGVAFIGSIVFATYLISVLRIWTDAFPPPSARRLTPRLYEDIGVINLLATGITTVLFLAFTLAVATFAIALRSAPFRGLAAAGIGAMALTGLPPLITIAYLASPQNAWPLAPSAVAAVAAAILARRSRDVRKTATRLGAAALTAFGSVMCGSIALSILLGLPAPTSAGSSVGYVSWALLPVCLATLMQARRARFT
jgi:hypothetical protein